MHSEAAAKRYDSARSFAAEAIAAAERAISEGRTGAARAHDEAFALVSELRPLAEETRQGIDAAHSAGLPLDFNSVERDYIAAYSNSEQAHEAYSDNQYQEALRLGRAARSEFIDINQQISLVAMEASRTK